MNHTHPPTLVCLCADAAEASAFAARGEALAPDLHVEARVEARTAPGGDPDASAEAVRTAAAGRPVHLLGHGAAAPAAVALAARRPGLVASLVLAGPDPVPSGTPLGDVTVPTLVICGDGERGTGQPYAGGIRDAVFVTVDGAGRRVHTERPDSFDAWVRSFVQIAEGLPRRAENQRRAS
ncbi:alpha/beta fold hydrolase [Actinomadura sp. WMMB 499]|uniref:alpha/beta fold hydrolase n=1 Tax=Actinomadura sp. WMMB 499 TaxID=1219491 RepID=UPI001248BAE1|nr:hypothetical protein [Actinomadura sp. WMMB 499]QFG23607.1 hypothetical protein F7P10_23280 [Actinomadura sp. WMMB 499]